MNCGALEAFIGRGGEGVHPAYGPASLSVLRTSSTPLNTFFGIPYLYSHYTSILRMASYKVRAPKHPGYRGTFDIGPPQGATTR